MTAYLISNPRTHQMGTPRTSKVTNMRSEQIPEVIQISKKAGKSNLTETCVFEHVFEKWGQQTSAGFAILQQIIKNRACNANPFLDSSNYVTMLHIRNWCKRVPNEGPKINEWSTLHTSTFGHSTTFLQLTLAPNDHQSDAKVVSQDPKCSKNGRSRILKTHK